MSPHTTQTPSLVHSPARMAEGRAQQDHDYAQAVRVAADSLGIELAEAIERNPAREVRTPGWRKHSTPAHEVLALEMETHSLALAELLRKAMRGEDVRLLAQLLVSVACNSHAANHAEAA